MWSGRSTRFDRSTSLQNARQCGPAGASLPGEDPEMKPSEMRREFVKRAAYIAPAILTLAAAPSYAKSGSDKKPKDPNDPKGSKDRHDD